MNKRLLFFFTFFLPFIMNAQKRQLQLTFLHTSDVHGSIFSYDYLAHRDTDYGLPAVYAYADTLRREMGNRLILTDGGDCLQGQPAAYYSNFVDTVAPHLVTSVMNQMGYVCTVMGNHDIETGHAVYDRWVRELQMPVLGANVVDTSTGQPYLTPYIIIAREGVRVALLGMVTPGIPNWLPEQLWSGLRFDDIRASSQRWIKHLQEVEKPDLIVGVFHSGFSNGISSDGVSENAVEEAARDVDGFDFILYGHDHRAATHWVKKASGDSVLCVAPRSSAQCMARVDACLTVEDGRVTKKTFRGSLPQVTGASSVLAQLFEAEFVEERLKLADWVNRKIGTLDVDLDETDAYFGPSRFIDLIHSMQLELTGADISFAAPLSYNSYIKAGSLTASDMFSIYRYENFLYTMRLTGREIKDYLEMSYDMWVNKITSPADTLLAYGRNTYYSSGVGFLNLPYNMDSAAGIRYEVDVTKSRGERINIISMADGQPFSLSKTYLVAVNSYRGNGGGMLLIDGAGIPREQLASRIVSSTDKDLRYYLMQTIIKRGSIHPEPLNLWRFVPDELAKPALLRDRKALFGK